MNHALFVYSDIKGDRNVLETAIKTLRKHSDCKIVIFSDTTAAVLAEEMITAYNISWLTTESMIGRRALAKVEVVQEYCSFYPEQGETVGVFDADLYFLDDPFTSLRGVYFDVGLTLRGYRYWSEINGGVFFLRINKEVNDFLLWHVEESTKPTWQDYIDYRKKFNHEKFGPDWTVGQDFLNCVYRSRGDIKNERLVEIIGLSNRYNYCPAVDMIGIHDSKRLAIAAYEEKSVKVLHLKSELKELIYEGIFEDVVLRHERGEEKWR